MKVPIMIKKDLMFTSIIGFLGLAPTLSKAEEDAGESHLERILRRETNVEINITAIDSNWTPNFLNLIQKIKIRASGEDLDLMR